MYGLKKVKKYSILHFHSSKRHFYSIKMQYNCKKNKILKKKFKKYVRLQN